MFIAFKTMAHKQTDIARAAKLAAKFHGRAPSEFQHVRIPSMPAAVACIGRISVIQYIAERDGKTYEFRHAFKNSARPHLCVSPDGQSVYMIGGSWTFTQDGFVDS